MIGTLKMIPRRDPAGRWKPPARYADFVRFVETWLWIEDRSGAVVPFILNPVQRRYLEVKNEILTRLEAEGREAEINVLKARKCGVSTLEQAESYFETSQFRGRKALSLAQTSEDTETLFRISLTFYREAMPGSPARPPLPSRDLSRRQFLFHDGASRFWIGTAGSESVGRGSTVQRVHASEVAHWRGGDEKHEDLLAGLRELVPDGVLVKESTPKGARGIFYRGWQEAKSGSGAENVLIVWFHDPANRSRLEPGEAEEIAKTLDHSEEALVTRHGLNLEQLKWRRRKKAKLGTRFAQEYPEDDESCFLSSGVCFFDEEALATLREQADAEVHARKLGGNLVVWRPPRPGKRYIIGADSASGRPGRDLAAAGVLEVDSGEQVARLHGYIRPEDFGRQLVKLARIYNHAILAPEINNHGHSTLNTIVNQERYPTSRIYQHVTFDHVTRKRKKVLGWETTTATRPLMLDALSASLEAGGMVVRDLEFLGQCARFNLQDNGKYEADDGAHDDLVVCWAIANYGRSALRPAQRRIFRSREPERAGA